jgi:hypothetical protein
VVAGSRKGRVQFQLNLGHGADFKNLSRFFYRGFKTSDRLKAKVHPGIARLPAPGNAVLLERP